MRVRDLFEVFFAIHDPTRPYRQGHDVGPQYRSIILYHSPEQVGIVETVIREPEASGKWSAPIVTEVVPFQAFYPAGDYHRQFFRKQPHHPYCQIVIDPKVRKFRAEFASRLKVAS